MLKIGEFAKLGQVSPKTLRLYHERNLLRPAWTDRFTGYRYYRREQLSRLHRILALKDLGFSLDQVAELLNGSLGPPDLVRMMRDRQREIQRHIDAEQARLGRVEARLQQLEQNALPPQADGRSDPLYQEFTLSTAAKFEDKQTMETKIISKPPFTAVGLPYFGKNEHKKEIPLVWDRLLPRAGEIEHMTGVAYGLCTEPEADGRFRYLAGFGVSQVEDTPEGMEAWTVPEQTYAVFPCKLSTIGETYQYAFETWLPESDYDYVNGIDFELYTEEFDASTGAESMFIYIPVEKKAK